MKIRFAFLSGLALLMAGCVAELRGSSYAAVGKQYSRVVISEPSQEAARVITDTFSRRGFSLIDSRPYEASTVYTFKGNRTSVTVVTGSKYGVYGSSDTIGSVFYARLSPQGQTTLVEMFGRPVVDGRVVCSDENERWAGPCDSVTTGALWKGRQEATGREEAEVIRGVIAELGVAGKAVNEPAAAGAAGGVASASAPAPKCRANELPEWKTADPVEKKKLLERCRGEGGEGK